MHNFVLTYSVCFHSVKSVLHDYLYFTLVSCSDIILLYTHQFHIWHQIAWCVCVACENSIYVRLDFSRVDIQSIERKWVLELRTGLSPIPCRSVYLSVRLFVGLSVVGRSLRWANCGKTAYWI